MADRLNPARAGVDAGVGLRRRRVALAALVVVVAVGHGWLADRLGEVIARFRMPDEMPARIQVRYVREMEPRAPPAVAPSPAPPAPAPPAAPRRERVTVAQAASAVPVTPPVPTPAPTPAPSPAEPVAEAPAPAEIPPIPPEPPIAQAPAEPAPPVAAPVEAAAGAPAFQWPDSTRVRYVLTGHYRGEMHGSAQVEWVRVGLRYQVHLDVTVGLPIAPLLQRRMTSEGSLSPHGLQPERYDEESKRAFAERRRATIRFEPGAVILPGGGRRTRWPGMQDAASQFAQLTYLFTIRPELLAPGNTVDVPLALPTGVSRWTYDVLEPETLYTPFGAVDAFPLKPRRVARPGGDLVVQMWFAPSLAYLPVRIRIHQDDETYIDLVIERKPQLGTP